MMIYQANWQCVTVAILRSLFWCPQCSALCLGQTGALLMSEGRTNKEMGLLPLGVEVGVGLGRGEREALLSPAAPQSPSDTLSRFIVCLLCDLGFADLVVQFPQTSCYYVPVYFSRI